MNSLLLQLVALSSSFLLTLPAGWCCGVTHAQADSVSAQATCCQKADELGNFASPAAPVESHVECRCSWDATLPQKPVQPDDLSALSLTPEAATFPSDRGQRTSVKAIDAPVRYGPRLHVLKCVWLC